ncbi:MAG TPA: transcription factor S [Candidatus Nanoarchaeia archaeon]|nr:transcription factor S [Candidatus Woesearchaeota archaeon]HLF53832.1 transcription factor S [Candidatus Nanoarchaeia archaeon]
MFCPKCGSILLPKKEGSKKLLACSCGYKTSDVQNTKIRETITKKALPVEVISKGELETLPKTKVQCPKCGHSMAYYWLVQTRAGDEPETKFLRCEKCSHTWRDYN